MEPEEPHNTAAGLSAPQLYHTLRECARRTTKWTKWQKNCASTCPQLGARLSSACHSCATFPCFWPIAARHFFAIPPACASRLHRLRGAYALWRPASRENGGGQAG